MTRPSWCSGRAHQQVAHRRCAHEQVLHPRHRRLKHGCLTPVARRAHHHRHPPTAHRGHKKQALWKQRSACVATSSPNHVGPLIPSRLARTRRPPCARVGLWLCGRLDVRVAQDVSRASRSRSRSFAIPARRTTSGHESKPEVCEGRGPGARKPEVCEGRGPGARNRSRPDLGPMRDQGGGLKLT